MWCLIGESDHHQSIFPREDRAAIVAVEMIAEAYRIKISGNATNAGVVLEKNILRRHEFRSRYTLIFSSLAEFS